MPKPIWDLKIHVKDGNRSRFIENAIRPHLHQLDPGESCRILGSIDEILKREMVSALSKRNFEKVTTLAAMGNTLAPFRSLCEVSENGEVAQTRNTYCECRKPCEEK